MADPATTIGAIDAALAEMHQMAGELAGLYGELNDAELNPDQRTRLSTYVGELTDAATALRALAGPT